MNKTVQQKNKDLVLLAFDTLFNKRDALLEGAGRLALIAIERQRSQEDLRWALDQIRRWEAERPAAAL